jgi:hypothetical protein
VDRVLTSLLKGKTGPKTGAKSMACKPKKGKKNKKLR